MKKIKKFFSGFLPEKKKGARVIEFFWERGIDLWTPRKNFGIARGGL